MRKLERIRAATSFIELHEKIKRLEAEIKRKEFKIRELKKATQEVIKYQDEWDDELADAITNLAKLTNHNSPIKSITDHYLKEEK